MKIGVSSGCFYPRRTEECLALVAESGVKYTEIFFNTDSELDEKYLYDLKKAADEKGIQVISVHPFTSAIETFMFFPPSGYKLPDSIKYYEKYFRACQILGAKYVVIHGCHTTAEYMDMKTYAEIMNKLSQRAREYGVYIAQENVVRFKCGYIENLKEFVRYADEEIMFTLDVKQSFRAQQDIWEIMSLMGKRISHIHISDYEGDRDSLLPGQGCFDFKKLFEKAETDYGVEHALIEVYNDRLGSVDNLRSSVELMNNI